MAEEVLLCPRGIFNMKFGDEVSSSASKNSFSSSSSDGDKAGSKK
jgi:hypothetical protein